MTVGLVGAARAAAVGVAVVVSAGCDAGAPSGARSAPAGTAVVRACELVSRADAETLLRGTALREDAPELAGGDGSTGCRYRRRDDGSGVVEVVVRPESGTDGSREKAVMTLRDQTYRGVRTREVEGLGDTALWADLGDAQQLHVFAGDALLVLTVTGAVERDAVVTLAETIVARL